MAIYYDTKTVSSREHHFWVAILEVCLIQLRSKYAPVLHIATREPAIQYATSSTSSTEFTTASPLTTKLLITHPTILLDLPSPSVVPGTRSACSTPLESCKRDVEPVSFALQRLTPLRHYIYDVPISSHSYSSPTSPHVSEIISCRLFDVV